MNEETTGATLRILFMLSPACFCMYNIVSKPSNCYRSVHALPSYDPFRFLWSIGAARTAGLSLSSLQRGD
jgi:hypothetical protein